MTAESCYYCFFLVKVTLYSSVPRRYWQNEITEGLRPYREAKESTSDTESTILFSLQQN